MCVTGVKLAIAASVGTIKEVAKELKVGGERWWVDSVRTDDMSIAVGAQGCSDVLNVQRHFLQRVDGLADAIGNDDAVVLLDRSKVYPDQFGFYLNDCRFIRDPPGSAEICFRPLWLAMVARLQAKG